MSMNEMYKYILWEQCVNLIFDHSILFYSVYFVKLLKCIKLRRSVKSSSPRLCTSCSVLVIIRLNKYGAWQFSYATAKLCNASSTERLKNSEHVEKYLLIVFTLNAYYKIWFLLGRLFKCMCMFDDSLDNWLILLMADYWSLHKIYYKIKINISL